MKRGLAVLLGGMNLALFGCQLDSNSVRKQRLGAHTYCVPAAFVALSDESFPDSGDAEYDRDPGSSYMLIDFPLGVVMRYAKDWRRTDDLAPGDSAPRLQHISVSVRPALNLEALKEGIRSDRSSFPETTPVPDLDAKMARLVTRRRPNDGTPRRWYFVHLQSGGELDLSGSDWLWGSCTNWRPDNPQSFECSRSLNTEGVSAEYQISAQNLNYYPDIDRMIVERLEAWRCD